MMRIACIIPTYNGESYIQRLLNSLQSQQSSFDTLVIDSTSVDATIEIVKARVRSLTVIPSSRFNHGGTRQLVVDQNPNYDIYVFLTQDVYLEDPQAIAKLVEPFKDPKVGAVCGRQVAHDDATPIAQHARFFNYPDSTQIKTIADVPILGIKTAFMSNSFAAYRSDALKSVHGFPSHVILSEDMYVAAKMILAGWKVVYTASSVCRHSHNYGYLEEFQRYFDIGVFHARESWIRNNFGGAGAEGRRYVISEFKFLGLCRLYQWPGAILRNILKFLGYKLGLQEARIPISLKRKLSMFKRYWHKTFSDSKLNKKS